jgi:signal transduction histidine kinase/FixJ family two-component response regulator
MKLKTSLQLGTIFPILFAIVMVLIVVSSAQSEHGGIRPVDALLLSIIGILGLSMAGVILIYSRSTLTKIEKLTNWINSVLKGNLEIPSDLPSSNDEVGQLSNALARMLTELINAYTSVQKEADRYKQELAGHKKGVEISKQTVKHLSEALERMKQIHLEDLRKERLHVLEQIIRGTVHDFSEALMPIVGACDYLREHPELLGDNERVNEQIRIIQSGADNAMKLLKDLASFCFYKTSGDSKPTDCIAVIEQTIRLTSVYWKEQARMTGRNIEVRTAFEMVPAVGVDETELRDAIVHLIMNAADAIQEAGTITITTKDESPFVKIEVRDTGIGMTPEVLERCLEPFFSTKNHIGTGMGLPVVNSVARRYGGTLEIESKPKVGTKVTLKLPRWTGKIVEISPPATPARTGQLKVLVVDDDALSREIIKRFLTIDGHAVELAENGIEARNKIKSTKYDVLIVDRAMPWMRGDELAVQVKKLSPRTAVIMLTGFGDIIKHEDEEIEGVDIVLSKPVVSSELRDAIAQALFWCDNPSEKPKKKTQADRAEPAGVPDRDLVIMGLNGRGKKMPLK